MGKLYVFFLTIIFLSSAVDAKVDQLSQYSDPEVALAYIKNIEGFPENPVILDAGAYIGDDSMKMISNYWPNGCSYAFEPVPEIYERLLRNTEHSNCVIPVNLALSDKNGYANFYLSFEFRYESNRPYVLFVASSLLEPKEPLNYSVYKFGRKLIAQTVTLDKWAYENKIKKIDLFWLDLQGCELQMLQGSLSILNTVKVIFLELEKDEIYKGQSSYDDIKRWLESKNFILAARNHSTPLQCIFIKK